MNVKKSAAALTLAAALSCTVALAGAPAQAAAADTSAPQSAGDAARPGCPGRHDHHAHMGAMNDLAKLTGLTVDQLREKYPQQTAWQIARTMGRLDALKTAVRASHKAVFDKMVSEGIITSADRDKMMADLDKRLAAIDGEKTVILGRPGYRPQFKKAPHGADGPQTSHRPSE